MSKEQQMDQRLSRKGQKGQVLVLFVIGIFAIIGMVGIVLDGGSVFAQRRDQQTVADLAAMAGADAYLNATGSFSARQAYAESIADSVAVANGYVEGTNGIDIDVSVIDLGYATQVKVDLDKPHRNKFAAVLGFTTWDVSVTATADATANPNGARGAMPLLFNAKAFPGAICNPETTTCVPQVYQLPGTGAEDVPQDATQFNWTIFCTASGNPCNGDSAGVDALINGSGANTIVYLDDDIGPLNAGTHTTLFDDLATNAIGETFPVPVVNDDGEMVGWAYFKLVSIEGAPDKVITGYFMSPVNGEELVVDGGHSSASLFTGSFKVRLTN